MSGSDIPTLQGKVDFKCEVVFRNCQYQDYQVLPYTSDLITEHEEQQLPPSLGLRYHEMFVVVVVVVVIVNKSNLSGRYPVFHTC